MIRTATYDVKPSSSLYPYLRECCWLSRNLANATTFRIRQLLSGLKKEKPTPNELSVIQSLEGALPEMNRRRESAWRKARARWESKPADKRGKKPEKPVPYSMPDADTSFIGYAPLAAWLLVEKDPDFLAPGLSRQTAQQTVKRVRRNFKSYFRAIKDYRLRPEAYTGRPKMPGYVKGDLGAVCVFTNQDCSTEGGVLRFPKTKEVLELGTWLPQAARLREVRVVPHTGKFTVHVVYDTGRDIPALKTEEPLRVMAMDLGCVNLAATASNGCMPAIIAKGGYIKSENQYWNKRRAYLTGRLMAETATRHPASKRLDRLSNTRQGFMRTEMGRIANALMDVCETYDIDTLVVGRNKDQKRSINIGRKNNQEFVSIPHGLLCDLLAYKCEEHGVRYLETEESYTSKASFIDGDRIPIHGQEGPKVFSGKRSPRGLYTASDGTQVNSDVNGAANIGRKALPSCFEGLSREPFAQGTRRLFGVPRKTGR